jgi:hypothetical protein
MIVIHTAVASAYKVMYGSAGTSWVQFPPHTKGCAVEPPAAFAQPADTLQGCRGHEQGNLSYSLLCCSVVELHLAIACLFGVAHSRQFPNNWLTERRSCFASSALC